MSLSILYSFKFAKGHILEIKFNELTNAADKEDRFQWYLLFNNKRYTLKFIVMKETVRILSCHDLEIKLDISKKNIMINEETFPLMQD